MATVEGVQRVAVLVNPTAGKGKGGKAGHLAVQALRAAGLDTIEISGSSEAEARALVADAVADGVDLVVACGGDGTANLALQAVAGTDTALAIVPLGTGDDNARLLGMPLKDPEAAAVAIANGQRRTVDVGRVRAADGTQRWFLGVLSAGFDSCVNERANQMTWPSGQARYLRAILAELRVFKPLTYRMSLDGVESQLEGMLIAVGNGVSYGGGMKVCPSAVIDDGLLSVTVLGKVSKAKFLRVFPKVFSGTHVQDPSVTEHSAKAVELESPGQIAYADGERVGPLPITVTVAHSGLTVIVPRD